MYSCILVFVGCNSISIVLSNDIVMLEIPKVCSDHSTLRERLCEVWWLLDTSENYGLSLCSVSSIEVHDRCG